MPTMDEVLQSAHKQFYQSLVLVASGRANFNQVRIGLHADNIQIGSIVGVYMTEDVWEQVVKPAMEKYQREKKPGQGSGVIMPP